MFQGFAFCLGKIYKRIGRVRKLICYMVNLLVFFFLSILTAISHFGVSSSLSLLSPHAVWVVCCTRISVLNQLHGYAGSCNHYDFCPVVYKKQEII